MNKNIEWPVDLIIKPTNQQTPVDENISHLRLKELNRSICPIGNMRLGLTSILNPGESFLNLNELDLRLVEKDIVGSSVWRDFSLNMEKVPLAWLNFRINFSSILATEHSRFIVSFYINSGNTIKGFVRSITNPFTPRKDDRFVCLVKMNE